MQRLTSCSAFTRRNLAPGACGATQIANNDHARATIATCKITAVRVVVATATAAAARVGHSVRTSCCLTTVTTATVTAQASRARGVVAECAPATAGLENR